MVEHIPVQYSIVRLMSNIRLGFIYLQSTNDLVYFEKGVNTEEVSFITLTPGQGKFSGNRGHLAEVEAGIEPRRQQRAERGLQGRWGRLQVEEVS